MPVLNLGVVAHVDAGKTSLTERLLFAGGVIDAVGSVDAGSTRTDSLELERRRGITIKTGVASFPIGDVTVNLIDTPGHPDFIAEVERALRVLDGAVLVISAVEGVQAQTRVLLRTLRRLRVPTLIFVNKIDRRGARVDSLLREIEAKLTPAAIALTTVDEPGTPQASTRHDPGAAERLVDLTGDDQLLTAYVRDDLPYDKWREALARRSRKAELYPVFFGSAVTGAGLDDLLDGLTSLLPAAGGDPGEPVSGTVFKVESGHIAYVRLFDGTLRVRDHLPTGQVVTGIEPGGILLAGGIAKVRGLRGIRVGDPVGVPHERVRGQLFPPPTLQSVVVPRDPADRGRLHQALTELAEQDPLINLRADLTLSLYGEVQKEVVETTLAEEYGIAVDFRETSIIHVEKPAGVGIAAAEIGKDGNPYIATIELRVEPGEGFALEVPIEQVPIHVFKTAEFFSEALAAATKEALRQGPHGWEVVGARVTVTRTGFVSPMSTAGEFRKLLPLVLADALATAGTVVCEPILRFELDVPPDTMGTVLGALGKFRAVPSDAYGNRGLLPASSLRGLELALPGLSRGEGVLETFFHSYQMPDIDG